MSPDYNSVTNVTIFIPKKIHQTHSSGPLYGKYTKHGNIAKFYIISDKDHSQLELLGAIAQHDESDRHLHANHIRLGIDSNEEGLKVKLPF